MRTRDISLAVKALLAAGKEPIAFLRGAARVPLEQQAAARIATLPVVELIDLTKGSVEHSLRLSSPESRHAWSLGTAEQLVLQILIQSRGYKTAFEIGTFNGGTTRLLADTLPDEGKVWTMDLPPARFDKTQAPSEFDGSQLGAAYRGSPAEHKITQIFADSLEYDFTPHARTADIVLVDGGHDYEHGVSDTQAAVSIVRSGGVILWDDFEPYWHELVNGICDAMEGRRVGRLAGTAYAIYTEDLG